VVILGYVISTWYNVNGLPEDNTDPNTTSVNERFVLPADTESPTIIVPDTSSSSSTMDFGLTKGRASKSSKSSVELHTAALVYTALLDVAKIPYVIFFGTLLGHIRDGGPIDGDDDVDLIIDVKYFMDVVRLLKGRDIGVSVYMKSIFMQIGFMEQKIAIDHYFYTRVGDTIVLPWHFYVPSVDRKNDLHLPARLVGDRKQLACGLWAPEHEKETLVFLYGQRWAERLSKKQYGVGMVDHAPVIEYKL
jgi:hypothetical protein